MTTATPGGRSRAPTRDEIVGREPELDRLAGFLDGVADGPSGLLLRGEAGMGKTTIWRAGVVEARERRFRTIACAPGEFETGLAFAALADLLEPVLDEALPELPEVQRHALEVALLRAAPGRAPLDPRAVSTATLGVLRHLARGSAVVVAIDDIQWLDSASAGALQFALRRLEVEPVGLLQTVRAGTAAARSLGLCPSVPRDRFELVEIGPLDLEQIERLLRPRLAEPFLRPTLLRVHRACAGNPFYAIEIARTLSQLTRPLTPGEPLPVP